MRLPPAVALQLLPAAGATAFLLGNSRSPALLAVLAVVSLSCASVYVIRRGGIVSFVGLFVASYIALYLIYPVTALALDLHMPDDERVAEYAFLTIGGLALFLLAHAATVRRRRTAIEIPPLTSRHLALAFWLAVLPLLGAVLIVATSRGSFGSLLAASRLTLKEEATGLTTLAQYLWVAGSVSVVLGPAYLRRHPLGWLPFLAFMGVAGVAGFLAFRTRSILILLFGSLAMGMWLRRQVGKAVRDASGHGRLQAPPVWRLVLVGAAIVLGMSYVRAARGYMELRGLAGLAEVDLGAALLYNLNRGDLAFTPIVFDVLGYVPERAPFLHGQSYYRLLFAAVPRRIWPDKPPNTQRIVASWLNPGVREQTTPPGIQGDLYINFGLAGIVGFILFGVMFGLLDRWQGLGRVAGVGGGFVPVFHLVRGGFTNPILMLLVLIVAARMAASVAEGRFALTPGSGITPTKRA